MNPKRKILDCVRVLDFTRVVAGPYCTRILADLGASVIKVEQLPHLGQGPVRSSGPAAYNAGKRSVAIDLKRDEGIEVALRLAAEADVVVENFRPGVMERFGLAYGDLEPINPRLIYASISGFGQTGTLSARRAYGATAHAEAGLLWVQQQAAGVDAPFVPGVTIADLETAVMAVSAVLAALYDRERTREGQWVDLTLMACQLAMLGGEADQALNGDESEGWRPYRHSIHAAADGYVNINIGGPRDWSRVATALGHEEVQMPDTIEEANEKVAGWVSALEVGELAQRLDSAGAPYGVVRTMREALDQPYFAERGLIKKLPDPIDGELRVVGSPLHFSNADVGPDRPSRLAGEHSRSILSSAGCTEDEIRRLLESSVAVQQG